VPALKALDVSIMTRLVFIIFITVCALVVTVDSIKNNVFLWYLTLLTLNVSTSLLFMNRPHYFKKLDSWLAVIMFPIVSFSVFIYWQYILHTIPITLLGSEQGASSLYFSLLLPSFFAALGLFAILAMPISLAFGRFSLLVPLTAMLMMMFTFESWFSIESMSDKLVLYENIWLGFVVSLMLYSSNKWVESKLPNKF